MPVDSGLDDHHDCSQNWNAVARPLGYKTGGRSTCQALQCWIIVYFDVEYSYSTLEGPMLLTLWWPNSLTTPVQNFTGVELNQWDEGTRAYLNKNMEEPIWNTLTQLTELKFLNSLYMLCYIVCYAKMSTNKSFNVLKMFCCFSTAQNRGVGTWHGCHLSHNVKWW